jgi:predicted RNase H-like HicB family nuclease
MRRSFSLEYWMDEGWYVGRLKEVPGVFSQGATLQELEENIRDAYEALMADEDDPAPEGARTKEVELEVG